MQERKTKFPLGTSTALMQSVESMSSYIGLTREQKRELLTHSLIGGQQTAVQQEESKPK